MPWRRKWQPTPVFLPGKSHGKRSLVGYTPPGRKRVKHNLATKQQKINVFALQILAATFETTRNNLVCSVQFSSVAQSGPTLCDPMNRSTPGLPVHHQLPVFTQTHVHRAGDTIQPSHPLSSPSPPAPNPSQHQGLFSMSQLFA